MLKLLWHRFWYDLCKGVKARLESMSDFTKSVEVSWNLMKYSDVNWPKSHGVSWSHLKSVGVRFSVEGRWNIMNHLNHLNHLTSTDFKGFEVNWSHLESVEVTWSHLKSDWDFGCFYPLAQIPQILVYGACSLRNDVSIAIERQRIY